MTSQTEPHDLVGCARAVLFALAVMPMWYALLIGILLRIDAPPWMWVTFWCYLPFSLLSTAMGQLTELLRNQHAKKTKD